MDRKPGKSCVVSSSILLVTNTLTGLLFGLGAILSNLRIVKQSNPTILEDSESIVGYEVP